MPDDPQEPTTPPPPADASQARYVVQEPVGNGGMGQVFRAWDQHLGRNVAVKRISEAAGVDAAIRREAGILAALHHPNIVTIFDFAADEEGPFVVMEYVEGRTLEDIVIGQPLDVAAFLELVNQVCRGLSSAHAAGLLHLDIKPGNIMLQLHRDGSFTSKILDFGLARAGHEEHEGGEAGETGELYGSPYTIAPEQLAREPSDARTDIYSLGCVFYYALSGKNPFEAPSVNEILQRHMQGTVTALHLIAPRVPPTMSQVIGKMISPHAADRPQTMEEVRALLLKASRSPAPVQAAAPAARRPGPPVRPVMAPRPPAAAAAAAPAREQSGGGGIFVVLALLVLAGAGAWWFYGPKPAEPAENAAAAPTASSTAAGADSAGVRPVLDPGDSAAVARHRGGTIVVEGVVASATASDLFRAQFLKFGNVPADAAVVSVREDVMSPEKARSFVGKRVRATGKVATIAGVKRVVVESASDLTTADGL